MFCALDRRGSNRIYNCLISMKQVRRAAVLSSSWIGLYFMIFYFIITWWIEYLNTIPFSLSYLYTLQYTELLELILRDLKLQLNTQDNWEIIMHLSVKDVHGNYLFFFFNYKFKPFEMCFQMFNTVIILTAMVTIEAAWKDCCFKCQDIKCFQNQCWK